MLRPINAKANHCRQITTVARGRCRTFAARMMIGIASWRREHWQVVLLVVLASALFSLQASISSAQVSEATSGALSAPVHPIYGKALKTIASDEHLTDLSTQPNGRMREALYDLVGVAKQDPVPRVPNRTNLLIDDVELQWSGGGPNFGYLYFCAPGPPLPLWEFAACSKSNLAQQAAEDLATQFVSSSDRTNRSGIGQMVFGTNWIRNGIRVMQGQVVLARLARDRNKVYALQFAKETSTNAEVFYVEAPLTNQVTTRPQPTPP
jgi:hypothetical protein